MRLLQDLNRPPLRFTSDVDVLRRLFQRRMSHQLLNLKGVGALEGQMRPEGVPQVMPPDLPVQAGDVCSPERPPEWPLTFTLAETRPVGVAWS